MRQRQVASAILVSSYSIVVVALYTLWLSWNDEDKFNYWCIILLAPVLFWSWCVISWCGSQLFAYAKREYDI
ncbi:HDR093Wp [Eremothecium sinecaudum]|uniref:HDR093Wp n=1 Tax=Eremothecium sinecaudum TaxID=45286 RepID=A0A120K292_9SACH|nr:HDR093Wp [Eremothecium sinecaudum]AMD20835.1 HDR093Wp [Eremothecium sinecaudum]